jgi:hypothetical protein
MNLFEEETIATLEQLFINVSELSQISIRDILKPDVYFHYEKTLQEAYDALTKVEDALIALGMKLEYQHYRLGGALDELKPLMIQPPSKADKVMDEFHKRFP